MVNHMAFVNGLCVKHCITSAYKQPQNQCLQPELNSYTCTYLVIINTVVLTMCSYSSFVIDDMQTMLYVLNPL